jgi:recombination protein RecT
MPKSKAKPNATKPQDIKSLILSDKAKEQFKIALPAHLKPDRFVRVALTAMNKNPMLLKCTQASLLSCLMDLSQMGLEPDGRKAHLIPFKNKSRGTIECQLIVDYKGLAELVRNTGKVVDIHADVVYENDDFSFSYGSDARLTHKPTLTNRGNIVAAYSFIKLKDGSFGYEVMPVEDIENIRKRSKAKDNGPWKTDWAEMAKKTVFRRHTKWLPLSAESTRIQKAVEADFDTPNFDSSVNMGTAEVINDRPAVDMPKAKSENGGEKSSVENIDAPDLGQKENRFQEKIKIFAELKEALGEEVYYKILKDEKFEHANEIPSFKRMDEIIERMKIEAEWLNAPAKDNKGENKDDNKG